MATDPSAKPKGLSLYANLLDPSSESNAPGTISRAPVVFKQPFDESQSQEEASQQKQQISAAALRFQPTKRPQIASQKTKHAPTKTFAPQPTAQKPAVSTDVQDPALKPAPKTTLADWTAEDDADEWGFGEKRQRGGRKKRKKNKEEQHVAQNWDDIYDPSRPNNYEEYRHSDEKIKEIRDWKDLLYAHRMNQRQSSFSDSDDDARHRPFNRFAPPTFHPPPPEEQDSPPSPPPPPPPPVPVPDDATGEDAYARRLRLSQQPIQSGPGLPPPPPPSGPVGITSTAQAPSTGTIARAPVRYNLPPAPEELPKTEAELACALDQEQADVEAQDEDAPRSLRPGQKGFASRLMSKYGWTKGSGLGANSSGIINPLQVKVEKQKKKPDSEGGGFVGPGGRGKIIGGKKKGGDDTGKFGPMSDVVILQNMLGGMDIKHELNEGNLRQEIGEECGEKYGRVERVFVDPSAPENAPVFIKFTSQLSALRAVNALEGRIFNGNAIVARFFDSDDFDNGVF